MVPALVPGHMVEITNLTWPPGQVPYYTNIIIPGILEYSLILVSGGDESM
jgi:hypothetical protein